jgi:hypothetical protein
MEVLMGKSSINGPFSMAMLNNQRVQYHSKIIEPAKNVFICFQMMILCVCFQMSTDCSVLDYIISSHQLRKVQLFKPATIPGLTAQRLAGLALGVLT